MDLSNEMPDTEVDGASASSPFRESEENKSQDNYNGYRTTSPDEGLLDSNKSGSNSSYYTSKIRPNKKKRNSIKYISSVENEADIPIPNVNELALYNTEMRLQSEA